MKKNFRIIFNSPVIITFTSICLVATILGEVTDNSTNLLLFSVYRSSLLDPLTYIRFIGHIFGHADFEHFLANIMLLLLIGPLLEEKYGASNLSVVILITAVITGLVHFIVFSNVLLGASGVVFAFILLSSITSIKGGGIPITFILVFLLYMGREFYDAVFVSDNVSQLTHIIGGIVGAATGFYMGKGKTNSYG